MLASSSGRSRATRRSNGKTPVRRMGENPRRVGNGPVLILYCEEGEGHASAARALAGQLAARDVDSVVHDALQQGLGRLVAWACRDAYRFQVRWLRWTYGLEYFLFTRVPPARAFARLALGFVARRPLLR